MNGSSRPSSNTDATLPTSTPVRWSFTIWYGCSTYDLRGVRVCDSDTHASANKNTTNTALLPLAINDAPADKKNTNTKPTTHRI